MSRHAYVVASIHPEWMQKLRCVHFWRTIHKAPEPQTYRLGLPRNPLRQRFP